MPTLTPWSPSAIPPPSTMWSRSPPPPSPSPPSNPFSFLSHLSSSGYTTFFKSRPAIPSHTSWNTKQLKQLQMLTVAPHASVIIERMSINFPVLDARPISGTSPNALKVGDGFWYVDPNLMEAGVPCPMMYQVVDLTLHNGVCTARRILLELPPIYGKGKKEGDVVNLERNLGEMIELEVKDVAMYPQLNDVAWKYFKEKGIQVMQTGTPSSPEWASDRKTFSPPQHSSPQHSSPQESLAPPAPTPQAPENFFAATFNDVPCDKNTFVPPASHQPDIGEYFSDADSDDDGFAEGGACGLDDSIQDSRESFSDLAALSPGGARASGTGDEWDEIVNRVSAGTRDDIVNEVRCVTPAKRVTDVTSVQHDPTLEKTQFDDVTGKEPEIANFVESEVVTPSDKFVKASQYNKVKVSPTTVCITFVQSRATKIQFHDEVSDDEVEEVDAVNQGAYSNVLSM